MTALTTPMDELRIAVGRTKALADVAVSEYDNASWGDADPEQCERMAYQLEAVADAATKAVGAVDRFEIAIANQQPVPRDEQW
jgi:hypothetical protein